MKIEHKVVPVIQTKVLDEAQGIVGAFVSVTGVVDSVKDRIIPGAYQSTLAQRTPKGVWSHDWDTPVSKTLKAEELLPGDDRLPKKTRNGDDWPTAAGALYVETQFNLGTQRGKDAFSDVVFFGDEQEWSIGYNVPPGTAKFDAKTGVRELSYVDLFEYSPVLFGAMDLTSTAGVKDAQEAFRQAAAAGTTAVDQVTVEEREEKDAEAPVDQSDAAADPVTGEAAAVGFVDASQATITTPQDPMHVMTSEPGDVPAGSGTNAGVALEPRVDTEALVTPLPEAEEPKAAAVEAEWKDGSLVITRTDPNASDADVQAAFTAAMAKAGSTEEAKAQVTLTGSYEERQQAVRKVLPTALDGLVDLSSTDEYGYATTFVTTEATFPNKVVAAAYDMTTGDVRYFEAGYTFGSDGATMKPAREVRVEAAVVAKGQVRAGEFKAAYQALRKAAGAEMPAQATTVEEGGIEVSITVGDGADGEAVKAAVSEALTTALADLTAQSDEKPAEGAKATDAATETKDAASAGTVTLDVTELLALERLRLEV